MRVHFVNADARNGITAGSNFGTINLAAGNWMDSEIETMDEGFSALVRMTGNNRLLKTADGDEELVVHRNGQVTDADDGSMINNINGLNSGDGVIRIVNNGSLRTVIYEIGHNWNEEDDSGYVEAFRAVAGWTDDLDDTAGYEQAQDNNWSDWWFVNKDMGTDGFARNYGKMNPYEDFATSFAAYVTADMGQNYSGEVPTAIQTRMADRFAVLDDFFASLA